MEEISDRFEVALRTWVANDGIVRELRRLANQGGLDSALVEAVEDALQADDREAYYEALDDFLRALREALAA